VLTEKHQNSAWSAEITMSIYAIVIKRFDVASNSGLTSGTPMLRRLPSYIAVVLVPALMLAMVPQVFAQKNHEHHERKHLEREQIVELEKEWRQATLADDVPTMDKLLSEDYLGITGEVLTKAQQLDHMRTHELMITKLETSELKIKLVGNVAIVTSLAQVDGSSDGEPLRGAFRYTRVYQRLANGTWKVTNFEVTPTTRQHALPSSQN
jgi:ketosteroid isomerase-like protein